MIPAVGGLAQICHCLCQPLQPPLGAHVPHVGARVFLADMATAKIPHGETQVAKCIEV